MATKYISSELDNLDHDVDVVEYELRTGSNGEQNSPSRAAEDTYGQMI